MWVSASSASCTAQVKYSQSGIPFAIGVKDERERDTRCELGKGKYFSDLNFQPSRAVYWLAYCYTKYIELRNWVDKL